MVEPIPIYNPFNMKNRMFTQKDIHTILKNHNLDYEIKNPLLFQNAMIHSSYVRRSEYTTPTGEIAELAPKPDNCLDLFPESYERLEHLGDSVLGCCVATYLSKRFPIQQEGFLTNLRKELVCNAMLGQLTLKISLNEFYVISKHNEDTCNGRTNIKKLGDILESFIGALWIDSEYDFHKVYKFIINLIESYIDIPKILLNDTNYKDQFQKLCQSQFKYTPTYTMLSFTDSVYTMAVIDNNNKVIGIGSSTTKKQGEQFAAREALKSLKLNN
jgi:ribonuclease-3